MEECEYIEDCKNKDSPKCTKCEYNPANFEKIERDEQERPAHTRDNKRFYIFSNNYEPI